MIYDVEAKRAAAYTIRNGVIEIRAARDVSFDLKLHDFSAPAGQRTSVKDIKALVP